MRASRGGVNQAHRGVDNKQVVHMGVEQQVEENQQIVDLKAMGTYNNKAHANTEFFTQYGASDVFEDIHKALCSVEGVTDKVEDEHRYRMNFLIQQKMPEIDLGEEGEQQEEQKEQ